MELATKLKHSKIIKILENENPVALPQATVSPVTWAHIKDRLERELPRLYRSLRKGAKLQALEHLEHTVAATLPDEFKEFYLANDGQKSGTAAIAVLEDADYNLIPLKEIENVWLMQKSLLEQGEFKGLRGNSDQEIQNDWWNTGWVPFASDEAGDYICIDLAPTAAGTKGQVIATWHDSRRRLHLSNSFYTWLFEQLARLREET
jgi:cell wall assembly regulator SMI1